MQFYTSSQYFTDPARSSFYVQYAVVVYHHQQRELMLGPGPKTLDLVPFKLRTLMTRVHWFHTERSSLLNSSNAFIN